MTIKIKDTNGKIMLVNWDRVDFVAERKTVYGKNYREIHMGKQVITTSETIKKIEEKTSSFSSSWYNKQTKESDEKISRS